MNGFELDTILAGGGAGSLIVALAYAYQQWQGSRRDKRHAPQHAASAAVTDAAAANSLLLSALQEERVEVQRLSGRVQELETQNALLYERMRDQRREYEREISDLRRELSDLGNRLARLQTRLQADVPPEDPAP